MNAPAVRLQDVSYRWPGASAPLFDGCSLAIAGDEHVFLRGPSGSGKTTLLGLIGGVLMADGGIVEVGGTDLSTLPARQRDRFRADRIGVVFQQFNLLPFLSLAANVGLPCRFSGARRDRALDRAASIDDEAWRLLDRLGLDRVTFGDRSVADLSVGQQQRVAVARALIGRPDLVIADEPTSALDADTRDDFLGLLADETRATGAALLFVSHDLALAPRFDRTLELDRLARC